MALFDVEALRREFDATFARPLREAGEDIHELLAIRVADKPYALRIAELGGVSAHHRVTRVPSAQAALRGLVGLRGALVPVFDLALLLGEPVANETPRWLALSRGDQPLALAFATVEGHLPVVTSELMAGDGGRELVEQVIRGPTGLRPVVSLGKVVSLLRGPAGLETQPEGKVERA